jgi:hypothetical protein
MHRSLAPALILVAACNSSSDGGVAASPIDAAGETAPTLCANEPRAQIYHQGIEQVGTSGHFKVKLLNITPSPVGQGDNRWNIALADAAGTAIGGATIALKPFLVDHGHAAAEVPTVAADPLMGQYTVSKIELALPGVWTFTFDVTAAAVSDRIVFTFCVDE